LYRCAYNVYHANREDELLQKLEVRLTRKLQIKEDQFLIPIIKNYRNFQLLLLARNRKHELLFMLPIEILKEIFHYCHDPLECQMGKQIIPFSQRCHDISLAMHDILMYIDRVKYKCNSFDLLLGKCVRGQLEHVNDSNRGKMKLKIWSEFMELLAKL